MPLSYVTKNTTLMSFPQPHICFLGVPMLFYVFYDIPPPVRENHKYLTFHVFYIVLYVFPNLLRKAYMNKMRTRGRGRKKD